MPLTMVVVTITLAVATGISVILVKEMFFSKVTRESNIAYYAADSGLACAIYTDDAYIDQVSGIGIFQYNDLVTPDATLASFNSIRSSRGIPTIALTNIKCATSAIFVPATTGYAVTNYSRTKSDNSIESGKTTTFNLRMDLGDGTYRCARVVVNKTATFRQIISRGYNTCTTNSKVFIERAVINTTEGD